MKRTKEREATADLAAVLSALPFKLTVRAGARSDLVLVAPDGRRTEVEVKALGSPTPADVHRLARQKPPADRVPVLVADRIVPRVRSQLSEAGWGWLDRRGHLYISTDGLLVDTDVAPLIERSTRVRPTLDTAVGLDVGVALLTQPHTRLSVRQLVAFTGRSLGAVHQALRGLGDEGLVQASGEPLNPELFWEAAARWRPDRIALGDVPGADDRRLVDQLGLATAPGVGATGWALTDTLAANAYGAAAVVRAGYPPDFYVPDERTIRVARLHLGEPVTPERRKATVALPPVGWVCGHRVDLGAVVSRRRRPAWPAAHPVVVALDLSTDAGRGREILDAWSPPEQFERVW